MFFLSTNLASFREGHGRSGRCCHQFFRCQPISAQRERRPVFSGPGAPFKSSAASGKTKELSQRHKLPKRSSPPFSGCYLDSHQGFLEIFFLESGSQASESSL